MSERTKVVSTDNFKRLSQEYQLTTRNLDKLQNDVEKRAPLDRANDLVATGGYRQHIGPWAATDLGAASFHFIDFADDATFPDSWLPYKAGSIVGLSVLMSGPVTPAGGILDIQIFKRGVSFWQGSIKGTSAAPDNAQLLKEFAKDLLPFGKGEPIRIRLAPNVAWTAAAEDFIVWLIVEI
jgi:hypothetical protein